MCDKAVYERVPCKRVARDRLAWQSVCKRAGCKGVCQRGGCVCVCDTSEETINFYRFSLYVLDLSKSCRGTELSDATLSNEAMHQRGKHPLATDVYLPKIV